MFRIEASSTERIEFHLALLAKLNRDPETVDLCGPMTAVATELERAYAARLALERTEIVARARLDAAKEDLEATLRELGRRAAAESRGRGPDTLFGDLLPGGVEKALRSRRDEQLQVATEVLGRLERTQLPGADKLRVTCQATLAARVQELRLMLEAYDAASSAVAAADHIERRVQADHLREVDRLAGALRARFPRDPRRQQARWPKVKSRRRATTVAEVTAPTVLPPVEDAA